MSKIDDTILTNEQLELIKTIKTNFIETSAINVTNIMQQVFHKDVFISSIHMGTILTMYWVYLQRVLFPDNAFIRKINPLITLFEDDNDVVETVNHAHSSKISIYTFYKGIINNNTNTYGKGNAMIPLKDCDFNKYLLYTSDFCINNKNVLRNNELLNTKQIVKYVKQRIYINGELYNSNRSFKYDFVDSVLKLQQNYQHLGTHLMCVYGYNLIKSKNISIPDNDILNTILEYGQDMRDVTEGFGKYVLLDRAMTNYSGLDKKQIVNILKLLENVHLKLHDNLLNGHLYNKITRRIYSIYIDECKRGMNKQEIKRISNKINMSLEITFNIMVNLLFLLTYYHNRSHYTLIHVQSFQYDQVPVISLLNQTIYGCDSCTQTNLLIKLKNRIYEISDVDANLVGNAHTN